jgi:hypothetical protein
MNIGFFHYAVVRKNCVQPIIVVQNRFTTTFFYGFLTAHGTIHIGTFLNRMNLSFEASGNKEWIKKVRPEWKVPAESGEQRVYVTYYTKSTLPVTCEIPRAYSLMRIAPRYFFTTRNAGGKGQVAADSEMIAIKWDSQVIGACAKTVNEMRAIQCNFYDITCAHIKIDSVLKE